jgi:uncharacterized membrane protein
MKRNEESMLLLEEIIGKLDAGAAIDRQGIADETAEQGADHASASLKAFSVIGGFLASLAFVGFLFVNGLYRSEIVVLVSGLLFIGGGIWLNHRKDSLIYDTFSISIFSIGYWKVFFALKTLGLDQSLDCSILILLALVSVYFSKSYLVKLVSILVIALSSIAILADQKWFDGIHVYNALVILLLIYLNMNEPRFLRAGEKWSRLYLPMQTALYCALLIGLGFVCRKGLMQMSPGLIWLSSVATIGGILFVVGRMLPSFGIRDTASTLTVLAACLLMLAPVLFAPAITGALLIILLSFRTRHRMAFAAGIAAFIYFTGQYYYDLEMTLLKKSVLLMTSGALFFLFYFLTRKKTMAHEKI